MKYVRKTDQRTKTDYAMRWNGSRWEPVVEKPVLARHPQAEVFHRHPLRKP